MNMNEKTERNSAIGRVIFKVVPDFQALNREGVQVNGGTAPLIRNLSSRCMWVVSLMSRPHIYGRQSQMG
jgi:hypothetical protein